MKKYTLVILILFFGWPAMAQQEHGDAADRQDKHHHYHHNGRQQHKMEGRPPFAYIGFSGGINNPSGAIGFDFDIPVSKYVTIGAGGGFSTWGNKLHFDAKYFLRHHQRGWALGGGLTFNSGDNNYRTPNMETVAGVKEQVYLDLCTQHNLYVAVFHYWTLGRRYNRFFTELGWSVPLVERKYIQLSGDELTQNSRNRIDRLSPGGLMAGIGFSFGLHH